MSDVNLFQDFRIAGKRFWCLTSTIGRFFVFNIIGFQKGTSTENDDINSKFLKGGCFNDAL